MPHEAEELFALAATRDFIEYGFEPEFIGRLPVRVTCNALTKDDLFEILKTSEGSIIRQYEQTLEAYGIEVLFKDEGLRRIAELAVEEKTGARGLMTVAEGVFRDLKFELPSTDFSSKEFLERQEESDAESQDRDAEPIPPKRYTRAAWLHFDTGYGAASCFVTKDLIDSQTPEEAEKRINALSASKAKRNFSENESGDMTAMRGAAGKAKGGKADFKTMDALIVSAQGSFDLNAHKFFRREGNLGEFK